MQNKHELLTAICLVVLVRAVIDTVTYLVFRNAFDFVCAQIIPPGAVFVVRRAVFFVVAQLAVINTLIPGCAEKLALTARAGERCYRTCMITIYTTSDVIISREGMAGYRQ